MRPSPPARDANVVRGSSAEVVEEGQAPRSTTIANGGIPGWTPDQRLDQLAPPQVAGLQAAAGNRAVAHLLDGATTLQRAPAGATRAGPAPGGTKGAPRTAPFNSFVDLLNGFQDLAAALINRGGAGLDSVHLGPDLTAAHRSLLWSIRNVLIRAQDADPASRRKAVATWPGVSARLLDALGDARKAGVKGEVLAAVADQVAMLNKRLGSARGRKDVPEAESSEDYVDTIKAIDQLLIENAGLLEAGPGIVREEAPGRPDIVVSDGIIELNAKRRGLIAGVKLGGHASSRHAQLVERLRSALILARTEKAGSAYAALASWRKIEGELRYVLQRGAHYVDGDVSEALGRIEQTRSIVSNHYAAVHGGNLQAVLSKQRAPGELKARKKVADTLGGSVAAGLAEKTSIEDVQNALDVIQNHLVKSEQPGEWTIANGSTSMRIRDDQAADLHAKAQDALRGYMQSLVGALAHARDDYDSIKLGNSRTKLRILGALGGADDPGSFDAETSRMIRLRDKVVKPLIDRGDYVGAFKLFLDEKPQVEKRVKAEADYDADLDTGYRRLATTMAVVQVALVSLIPIAGEAALATAPAWAVGLTATAAGGGGAFVGEATRQGVTGEHDAGKLLSRTWQGTVMGGSALTGAATRQLGGVLSAGGGGFAATGGEAIASSLVGGAQSLAGGGSFGEGAAGGFVGSVAGQGTKLLPQVLQQGTAGKLVQVAVGAGVGEVTTGDALGGAAGAIAPAFLTKAPGAGAPHDATPSAPSGEGQAGAPTTGTAPTEGPSSVPFVPGAETVPGTFPPRAPAAPAGPVTGSETIPGTFPPRAPAPPAGPVTGAETTPGTFPPRAPAAPAGPVTGNETTPGPGIEPRPPAPAEATAPAAEATAPPAETPAAPVPAGAETAAGSVDTAVPAPATGERSTAPTPPIGEAGTMPAGSQPNVPPVQQPVIPTGRPLVPTAQVPHDLAPSPKPAFDINEMKAKAKARAQAEVAGEPIIDDQKHDIPAGGAPSTVPSAPYAPEEKGRYARTGEKPVAGISKDQSYVVTDTKQGNKKFLFKPLDAERPVDRAEERGIREGQQAPREVAAPMVAKELGVAAPENRLVTIDSKQGVLVEWHETNSLRDLAIADPEGFKRLIASEAFREAMTSFDALDYLVNNLDRATNFGNYLYEFTPSGLKLTAIDHGLTFTSTKERASIDGYTRDLPEKYPPELVRNIERLSKNRAEFIEKIRPFVGDAAVEGFVHRLDIMIKDMHAKQAATP